MPSLVGGLVSGRGLKVEEEEKKEEEKEEEQILVRK